MVLCFLLRLDFKGNRSDDRDRGKIPLRHPLHPTDTLAAFALICQESEAKNTLAEFLANNVIPSSSSAG